MDNSKVSIIIPVFNGEQYLRDCFNSLINQSWNNIEIIFVDDGSTDNSLNVLKEFSEEDHRVIVYSKHNGGTHTARNMGIMKSTGQYITFMDPDDWLDLDAIKICMEYARQYDVEVIRYNYVREYKGRSCPKRNTLLTTEVCRDKKGCERIARQAVGLVKEELRHPESLNFLASVCFCIYKKSLIEHNDIEFYNIREIGTFSDGLFNIEVYLRMNSFLYVDKALYHYRKDNLQSATSNYRGDFDRKQMKLYGLIKTQIENCSDDFIDAYKNRISLSTLEIVLNSFKKRGSIRETFREVKEICNNPIRIEAYDSFSLVYLPFAYKVFHFFVKRRLIVCSFLYASLIRIRQIMNNYLIK